MTDRPRLRLGALGAARITPNALVEPARGLGGTDLVAIAAREPARADAFASEHGFQRAEADYASLVDAPDIDLIYNALPIHLHAEWTIRALEAGKHVLCEKPFAMNAAEAGAMLAAAEASGRRVIEAFHYRYHPAFKTALAWLAAGEIGTLECIDAQFNVAIDPQGGAEIRHRPDTGGGAFMDLGCYPLSWALMATGTAPVEVTAEAELTSLGVDERLEAHLTFPCGITATLAASMAPGVKSAAHLTLTGSAGRIEFRNPLAPHIGARLQLHAAAGTREAEIDPGATYTHQLAAIDDALAEDVPLPTEGEIVLRQQSALDAIYTAAGLGHLRQNPPGAPN